MDGSILADFFSRLWKGIECNGSEVRYDAVIDASFSEPNRQRTDECEWFLQIPIISSDFDMFSVPEVVFGEYLGNSFQEYYKHNNWGSSAVWAEIRWPLLLPKKSGPESGPLLTAGVKGFPKTQWCGNSNPWLEIIWEYNTNTSLWKNGSLIRYFIYTIFFLTRNRTF